MRSRLDVLSGTRSVLVVEQGPGVSQGVANILESCGVQVRGVATTCASALELARRLSPDLVVIETMPELHADRTAWADAVRSVVDAPILYVSVSTAADGQAAVESKEAVTASPESLDELFRGLPLSPRERQLVGGLLTYGRIPIVAEVLGISVHTARNHLKAVLRKLRLHSQDELFRLLLLNRVGGTRTPDIARPRRG